VTNNKPGYGDHRKKHEPRLEIHRQILPLITRPVFYVPPLLRCNAAKVKFAAEHLCGLIRGVAIKALATMLRQNSAVRLRIRRSRPSYKPRGECLTNRRREATRRRGWIRREAMQFRKAAVQGSPDSQYTLEIACALMPITTYKKTADW
jgi:hypothetical protein